MQEARFNEIPLATYDVPSQTQQRTAAAIPWGLANQIQVHPIYEGYGSPPDTPPNPTDQEPKKKKSLFHTYSWLLLVLFALFFIMLFLARCYNLRGDLSLYKDNLILDLASSNFYPNSNMEGGEVVLMGVDGNRGIVDDENWDVFVVSEFNFGYIFENVLG